MVDRNNPYRHGNYSGTVVELMNEGADVHIDKLANNILTYRNIHLILLYGKSIDFNKGRKGILFATQIHRCILEYQIGGIKIMVSSHFLYPWQE